MIPRKHFSWTSPWPLKMDKPWFFPDKPEQNPFDKISSYQDFTSKQSLRVREVPGSIPSQGPRHTKDVIKMVPVVPLFSTQQRKRLALSQELR